MAAKIDKTPKDAVAKAAGAATEQYLREQREAAIDAMVSELRKQAQPTLHPELLDAISFSADAPAPPNAGLPAGFPHTKPPPVPVPEN